MPGKITFAVLTSLLALGALGAPLAGAAGHPLLYLALHSFFSRVCHQGAQRSFLIDGFAVAVCARCLGIYLGAAAGALLTLWRSPRANIARRWFFVACALNVLDVGAEFLQLHGNLPILRLLLGLAFGLSTALVVNGRSFRQKRATSEAPTAFNSAGIANAGDVPFRQ